MLDGEKLLAVTAFKLGAALTFSGPPRYFKRFNEVQDSKWIVGRRRGGNDDRWDACTFCPNKDVRIVGVGIFESYPAAPRDLTYYHKYILSDASGQQLQASEVYEEQIPHPEGQIVDHIFKYRFQALREGVVVRAGQKWEHGCFMVYADGHDHCFKSSQGAPSVAQIPNEDQGLFQVTDSNMTNNGTYRNTGLIPGLLYYLL